MRSTERIATLAQTWLVMGVLLPHASYNL